MAAQTLEDCIYCKETSEKPIQRSNNIGLWLAAFTGGSAVVISAICFPFVSPALRRVCLPYVPASTAQVQNVLQALKKYCKPASRTIDLGSGDGRIVIEAAKSGFPSLGVELNPVLVYFSRISSWKQGTKTLASFQKQDLFKVDYSKFDNVVIFGVEEMMPELEVLFDNKLNKDSKVIACRFPLPNWKPLTIIGEGIDTVWVYART